MQMAQEEDHRHAQINEKQKLSGVKQMAYSPTWQNDPKVYECTYTKLEVS